MEQTPADLNTEPNAKGSTGRGRERGRCLGQQQHCSQTPLLLCLIHTRLGSAACTRLWCQQPLFPHKRRAKRDGSTTQTTRLNLQPVLWQKYFALYTKIKVLLLMFSFHCFFCVHSCLSPHRFPDNLGTNNAPTECFFLWRFTARAPWRAEEQGCPSPAPAPALNPSQADRSSPIRGKNNTC